MKKALLVIFIMLFTSAIAMAEEQPTATQQSDGRWVFTNPQSEQAVGQDLTLLTGRVKAVEEKLELLNTMFGVVSAGGGYVNFAGADEGMGISQFTLSFRWLRPVGPYCECYMEGGQCKVKENTNPHFIGLEVGSGFGSADKFFQLSPSASFLWYPVAHFGVVVGYQYTRAFDVAGEVDAQAHLGRFGLRIPILDFGRVGGGLELEFFGLVGYGEHPKTDVTHQIDPRTNQEFTSRTYSTKNGFAGGGGAGLNFVF